MSELLKSREGRLLRLTLNRPEKNNLLTLALRLELLAALEEAAADSQVGCVLLDASGPMFCGGLDMEEVLEMGPKAAGGPDLRLFGFGMGYAKPVVAAVQGPCLGAGVGLAANSHVVVAAQGVKFGLTEIRCGFWPFAVHGAVVRAMGERRVLELSLTGRVFSSQDAMQYGLVHEIAPAFELDDRATSVAQHLASISRDAIWCGLEFMRRWRVEPAGSLAEEMAQELAASADFQEGVRAMREARKPDWPSLKVE